MSIKQEYEDYAARREALAKTHFGPIWLNPLDRYVHPSASGAMCGMWATAGCAST